MAKNKSKFTIEEIIEFLRKENENRTIEGNLLRTKMIRELYKQLGDLQEKDFKEEFRHGSWWGKFQGYTKDIKIMTEGKMLASNKEDTRWCITYPSRIKKEIEKDYREDGWHCTVQSYNVICRKYVKHPRYKNLWVYFYSTKDCCKFEYIIEEK